MSSTQSSQNHDTGTAVSIPADMTRAEARESLEYHAERDTPLTDVAQALLERL